jgi:hypothetical protein
MKKVLTLEEYALLGLKKGGKCFRCQRQFTAADLQHDDHSGGWKVKGIKTLQWLWFHCEGCNYDTSLQTFGIDKPRPIS